MNILLTLDDRINEEMMRKTLLRLAWLRVKKQADEEFFSQSSKWRIVLLLRLVPEKRKKNKKIRRSGS